MTNKKAVSLMLSYVLLIIIAISIAVGVYAWLRFIAKGQEPIEKCPEGVSLIIQNYECLDDKRIQIKVENRGRFNISGYAIRGTENKSQEAWFKLKEAISIGEQVEGMYLFPESKPLPPNTDDTHKFSYEDILLGKLEKIEIEPFRIQEKKTGKKSIVFCDNAVINQEVNCT